MSNDQPDGSGEGMVGRTVAGSRPWWPPRVAERRPNVVVIVLDDVGFAQLGCYGASTATPSMDALAERGLRYTNFHATALCSPTRASLLTGRNHHAVGMGFLAAFDTGFPSYRGRVSARAATMAELLHGAGYGTYAVGKWHLTPPTEMTASGPFDQWPTQRGFGRYYGFLGGEEEQWAPELWYDQHRVDPPEREGYHLSEDLVDRATEFVDDHRTSRPDDPFLLYVAFGACHAPHQAPDAFIAPYEGAFDHGWDEERRRVLARQIEMGIVPTGTEMSPRNPGVSAWEDLDPVQRRVYARMQEVFAGFMTHTDAQIGRLVAHLARLGVLDETLIVLMSDNGASGEGGEHGTANEYRWFLRLPDSIEETVEQLDDLGGPTTHGHYPTGWAQAGNTPLRFYKRYAYAGGVRVPFIVSWPEGIGSEPSLRTQFHHVIDVMPTVLEACGVGAPEQFRGVDQLPIHGTSMLGTFADPAQMSTREVQYFETAGYRGIVAGDWKAIADHRPGEDFDGDRWELYRLSEDVSECRDLSAAMPGRTEELAALWWREAERYGVLPLDDRMQARMAAQDPSQDRTRYEMLAGTRLLNSVAGPNFSEREFRITAHVEAWQVGHDGVLLAWGRRATGMTLFVREEHLVFDLNLGGRHEVIQAGPVPIGSTRLGLLVRRAGDRAVAALLLDREPAVEVPLRRLLPSGMGLLPTQCGYNSPSPVSPQYAVPFRYQGGIERVVIELEPRGASASEADWLTALAQQ